MPARRGFSRPSSFAGLASKLTAVGALLVAAWTMGPAMAMDTNQPYELVPAFPEYQARGPQGALGVVLWSDGFYGRTTTNSYPPPMVIKSLVTHGWDATKINRNPALEGGWLTRGVQNVNTVIQQVAAAQNAGYARVILGGYGYGATIALEAAIKAPVYGMIALSPGKSGGNGQMADNVQYTLAQIKGMLASRALVVVPSDDETLPGFNQGPDIRQALDARGLPSLVIDQQVHGRAGAYSAAFWPYASCATTFFSPDLPPRPGQFQCYRDEFAPVVATFGLNLRAATAVWAGYFNTTGQPVIILEHRTPAGSTIDIAYGSDLLNRTQPRVYSSRPARWVSGQLGLWLTQNDALTLDQQQGTNK